MNKKFFLIGVLVLSLLFLTSCKKEYFASVIIENIGEIVITASVDGDASVVNPGEAVEWTLSWKGEKFITVRLYAEPLGFNDYDEEYATLGGGDEYVWTTGWVYVAKAAKPQKVGK